MKKVLLLIAVLWSAVVFAGGGLKFEKAVENEILFLEDSKTYAEYAKAAKSLKVIADKNTDKWEGFYWTAYAMLRQASMCEDQVEKNKILKDADYYIYRTELLRPKYAEMYILKAWYFMELIRVSPFPNQEKFGEKRDMWVRKAYDVDGTNPRFFYIRAYEEFNKAPEDMLQREKARSFFKAAVQMYGERPKPKFGADPLAPRWGADDSELMAILLEGSVQSDLDAPGIFDEVGDPTKDAETGIKIGGGEKEGADSKEKDNGEKGKKDKKKKKGLFGFFGF
ncbi:MAG: hypothetical protein ACJAY8_001267 [Sphingobacteriales bacterium]|jgi:hypothetical protein